MNTKAEQDLSPLEKRVQALTEEGFPPEKAMAKALEEARLNTLIAEKRAGGLTTEQARAVAEEQIAEDRRQAIDKANREAEAKAKADAEKKDAASVETLSRRVGELEAKLAAKK